MCPMVTYTTSTSKIFAGIAVDSSFVYWADHGTTPAIDQAPLGGGTPQTFYSESAATLLATDGASLVWVHLNTQIDSRPLGGGAVTVVANASGILTMALHAGYVYFGTSSGTVTRAPIDGSANPTNITFAQSPQSIVADDTNVYVATFSGDVVYAPITGQGVGTTTLASGVNALALADDATNLYWIAPSGDVVSHAKVGPTQTVLAKGQDIVTNLATDGTSLYWGAADGSNPRALAHRRHAARPRHERRPNRRGHGRRDERVLDVRGSREGDLEVSAQLSFFGPSL